MTPSSGRRRRFWTPDPRAGGLWREGAKVPPGDHLAALRRGLGCEAGTAPAVWPYYRTPTDDELARRGLISAELRAEHGALALFGLHQQSQDVLMHKNGVRLGQALRRLHLKCVENNQGAESLSRRVEAAAASTGLPTLLVHLRGLITQLRGLGQPLDYDHVLQDLWDWQTLDRRRRAMRRWGLDFYPSARDESPPA
ncbi:type I-E CRISPR-associated protein Cse2/CasB [Rhizohabitans arisaemae]|uniref:type I-E CRISPR-associated protein Cse2/CasB n=1 Tax=Rhizohabitans arisaemae TaxID=2720610 RepID=UPI0024B24A55|nr:type I-E CRISPR-associated protein Cse2/CasB [Rhizohabitans arisaemae]